MVEVPLNNFVLPSHGICTAATFVDGLSVVQATGNQWNADFTPNALSDNPGSCNIATYEQSHDQSFQEEGHDHVSWNNSLGHRRVHSAPNIMEHMSRDCPGLSSPRWRDPSLPLPWLSSDLLKAGIRESAIPEGRRFEVNICTGSCCQRPETPFCTMKTKTGRRSNTI